MKRGHIEKLKDREFNNFQWQDLVACGVVEYIDTMEEETTMIATSPGNFEPLFL
jgi:DNA-directed RNA polymerase II subunit RPB2